MRIADVLRGKRARRTVATIRPEALIAELLTMLAEHNIGAMVVCDAGDRVVGIVSERDVVRELARVGAELLSAPVATIMTERVFTCVPSDTVDSLTVLMTEQRVRHVPVLDHGVLCGIVSIGDVVKSRISQLESDRRHLQAYITQG